MHSSQLYEHEHEEVADIVRAKGKPQRTPARQQPWPPTVTAHPLPAAGEEIFHRLVEMPKSCKMTASGDDLTRHRRASSNSRPGLSAGACVQCDGAVRTTLWERLRKRCRLTLARSCTERDCESTRTKNVSPSADGMCASSSLSRWTPRRPSATAALGRADQFSCHPAAIGAATWLSGVEKKLDLTW